VSKADCIRMSLSIFMLKASSMRMSNTGEAGLLFSKLERTGRDT